MGLVGPAQPRSAAPRPATAGPLAPRHRSRAYSLVSRRVDAGRNRSQPSSKKPTVVPAQPASRPAANQFSGGNAITISSSPAWRRGTGADASCAARTDSGGGPTASAPRPTPTSAPVQVASGTDSARVLLTMTSVMSNGLRPEAPGLAVICKESTVPLPVGPSTGPPNSAI